MKKFNASDLSKKPSQVFAAAREDGAIIQHKDRQGKVVEEFVIIADKPLRNSGHSIQMIKDITES